MKIYMNRRKIELFQGAKLKHALLKTDESLYKAVVANEAEIYDEDGNKVDVDGSVDDGFCYTVKFLGC